MDDPDDEEIKYRRSTCAQSSQSLAPLALPGFIRLGYDYSDAAELLLFLVSPKFGIGAVVFARFHRSDGGSSRRLPYRQIVSCLLEIPRSAASRTECCCRGPPSWQHRGLPNGYETYSHIVLVGFFPCSRWIDSPHCRCHVYFGHRVAEMLESSIPEQR